MHLYTDEVQDVDEDIDVGRKDREEVDHAPHAEYVCKLFRGQTVACEKLEGEAEDDDPLNPLEPSVIFLVDLVNRVGDDEDHRCEDQTRKELLHRHEQFRGVVGKCFVDELVERTWILALDCIVMVEGPG